MAVAQGPQADDFREHPTKNERTNELTHSLNSSASVGLGAVTVVRAPIGGCRANALSDSGETEASTVRGVRRLTPLGPVKGRQQISKSPSSASRKALVEGYGRQRRGHNGLV
jgi:hypothetical protein